MIRETAAECCVATPIGDVRIRAVSRANCGANEGVIEGANEGVIEGANEGVIEGVIEGANEGAIVELHLPPEGARASAGACPEPDDPLLRRAAAQLREYFAGTRTDFDLPLAPAGTPWQQRVWRALRDIPYGETVAYADIARSLGAPGASRAVGGANGANPIAIVIPCHRVIAAGGGLGGYSGGLDIKRRLLDLERRVRLRRG